VLTCLEKIIVISNYKLDTVTIIKDIIFINKKNSFIKVGVIF
jgi:hypothetical protein